MRLLFHYFKIKYFDSLDLTSDISCAKDDGVYCSNSANYNLYKIIKSLGNCTDSHFVDLGCGKGGVLYLVSNFFKFKKITGIDRDINCISICKNNLKDDKNINIVCLDVKQFSITPTMNIFYMYNPFGHDTINKVIDNILISHKNFSREIYILYKNAIEHELILSKGFKLINTFLLHKLKGKRNWNYESMPNSKVHLYKLTIDKNST